MTKRLLYILFLLLSFATQAQIVMPVSEQKTDTAISQSTALPLKITSLGQQTTPIPLDKYDREMIDGSVATVTFKKAGKYAFDAGNENYQKSSILREFYQKIQPEYFPAWKLILEGQADIVKAKANIRRDDFNAQMVIFTTPQGTRFKSEYNYQTNEYTINLASGVNRDVQEIYALYPKPNFNDSYLTIGKLNLITYKTQTPKVKIVSVSGNSINVRQLKSELDSIYFPVGVNWQVEEDTLNYPVTSNFFGTNSELLSDYNAKMKDLQDAYKASKGVESHTSYIFILNNSGVQNNRDCAGFMPRGRRYGYVFKANISGDMIYNVIAHELGHGRFRLRHSFDNAYGATIESTKGTTNNLMDYANNTTQIAKFQWDAITDPALIVNPFESDEASMFVSGYAITPDYKYFVRIPDSNTAVFVKNKIGTLPSLVLNNKQFTWDNEKAQYLSGNETANAEFIALSDALANNKMSNKIIYLLYNLEENCEGARYAKVTFENIKLFISDTTRLKEYINTVTNRLTFSNCENYNKTQVEQYFAENESNFTENECLTRAMQRALESITNPASSAIFNGLLEYEICLTEENKIPADAHYAIKFGSGFANEILQTIDIDAMQQSITNLLIENIKHRIKCVSNRNFGRLMTFGITDEQIEYFAECEGLWFFSEDAIQEKKEIIDAALQWIQDNYDNPYIHGKTTALVLTFLIPYIGEVKAVREVQLLTKLESMGDESVKLARLLRASKGKTTEEIVALFRKTLNVGDEIAGIAINRIKQGSLDKIFVIGTDMNGRIVPFAEALEKQGYKVELFSAKYQTKPIIIEGKSYTWQQIMDDWAEMMEINYRGQSWVPYTDPNALRNIRGTLMYRANEQFIQRALREGTIIDIGRTYDSHFYDMEILNVFR